MHIWTETPLTEMWNQLRYLGSPSNVNGLLTGKIQSQRKKWCGEAEERAFEIAACIQQADEYFAASEEIGLATKPLLQFYGVQSLAKALILSNDPNIDLSNFKYHGLRTGLRSTDPLALQQYANSPSSWEVESEFAITDDGVFPHLSKIAGDSICSKGIVLRFKELIRCLPDLAQMYRRHYAEPSYCFYLYSEPQFDATGRYEIRFKKREDLDGIRSVFPELSTDYEQLKNHDYHCFRSIEPLSESPSFGVIEVGTVAGNYYVRPHSSGMYKSLTIIYAALHILSTVVRYKPAFWMSAMGGEKSASVSIVEAFCNLARRRFPNDVLEGIWHERFTYGVPGRLA